MGIIVFISYSMKDSNQFQIAKIAQNLVRFPEIDDVLFADEDVQNDFIKYMNEFIGKCDIFLLFCTNNSLNSDFVGMEWRAALSLKKRIIPIYIDQNLIPPLLSSKIGIKFNKNDINETINDIYQLILKKLRLDTELKKQAELIKSQVPSKVYFIMLLTLSTLGGILMFITDFAKLKCVDIIFRYPVDWGLQLLDVSKLILSILFFVSAIFAIINLRKLQSKIMFQFGFYISIIIFLATIMLNIYFIINGANSLRARRDISSLVIVLRWWLDVAFYTGFIGGILDALLYSLIMGISEKKKKLLIDYIRKQD